MNELKNWTEVTIGLYRYAITEKLFYEIHVLHHEAGTNILTAKASLFLAGFWRGTGGGYFERECLLSEHPVFECLKAAQKDNEENNG